MSESYVYNYPNPSKGDTVIRFPIPKPQEVKIIITDIMGSNVWKKELKEDEVKMGINRIKRDGKDISGKNVTNGVYFIKITVEDKIIIKKLVIVK